MITAKMTHHAGCERADRLAMIAEHIGVGSVLYKFESNYRASTVECITSTGVLIVMDKTSSVIITAFCPRINKMNAIFCSHGFSSVPPMISAQVERNQRIIKRMGLVF